MIKRRKTFPSSLLCEETEIPSGFTIMMVQRLVFLLHSELKISLHAESDISHYLDSDFTELLTNPV